MPITQFVNPFGIQLEGRNTESEIASRNARTSLDLFAIQQAIEERAKEQEYMRRTTKPPPQPGQPQKPQTPQQQPSPSDLILGQMDKIDQNIQVAAGLGLSKQVEQLQKQRDAMMARYSIAKTQEATAQEKADKARKERIATVSRFASGANEVLSDEKMSPDDKLTALKELEDSVRDEDPQAYKVISGGKPINWADPRVRLRMKALEQQAIDPEKRAELSMKKADLDERRRKTDEQIRKDDQEIAIRREGVDIQRKRLALQEGTGSAKDAEGKAIPQDLHGEAFLEKIPDEGERDLIRSIADGKTNINTISIRNNQRADMAKKVLRYRPDWDQKKFPIYQAVMKDFTSGVASKNVTAINTAISHMGTMYDMAHALENHDTQALNSVVNKVRSMTGDPRVNNFETAAAAVSSEMMRVFRQVGASEVEQKDWEKRFSNIQSPEQLDGAIKTAAKLLKGRIDAVNDQWKRGMDSKEGFPNLLAPRAKATLNRIGVPIDQVEGESPKESGGKGGVMSLEDYVKAQEAK